MSTARRPNKARNTFALLLLLMECMQFISMQTDVAYVTNLTPQCLRCLCVAATDCDHAYGCKDGYCGPYKISRVYWADGGKSVMQADDPKRVGAFEECAENYKCAQNIVKDYMLKYARVCDK